MEFTEAVRRRRMVRSYDPTRPVPEASLEAVLSPGVRAPSAGFTQGISFLVLTQPQDLDAFWRAATDPDRTGRSESAWLRGMRTAPALVLVWTSREAYLDRYAEADKNRPDRDLATWSAPYWFVDAGMASMAILLAAVDAGLAACFFGVPPERTDRVRQTFCVPDDQISVGVISLGYPAPDERRAGSPTRRVRKPSQELIHRGHW
ncbi:MAG TPA: nitroreductase family protein [Propionibacteriaceae bacterium]